MLVHDDIIRDVQLYSDFVLTELGYGAMCVVMAVLCLFCFGNFYGNCNCLCVCALRLCVCVLCHVSYVSVSLSCGTGGAFLCVCVYELFCLAF